MTSFVNIKYSAQHHGAGRTEPVAAAQPLRPRVPGSRGLATLFLSAMTAAVMVAAAYQVMDTAAEADLLIMWLALWVIAFAVLALFAEVPRQLAARVKTSLDAWSQKRARARADERLWAMAKVDPRLMADLQAAILREGADNESKAVSSVTPWGERVVTLSPAALQDYPRSYI